MVTWRGPGERESEGQGARSRESGGRDRTVRTQRIRQQPWSDPRLVLGVLLVLGATVLGAYVVDSSDSRTGYWSVAQDVQAGEAVQRADLVETRAAVSDDVATSLLRTDEDLPASVDQLVWTRAVAAGTLLDTSSLGRAGSAGGVELPLSVRTGAAPDDLSPGDRVDVWVGPAPEDSDPTAATRAMEGVTVLSTGSTRAGGGGRTVLVDVSGMDLGGDVVAAVTARHVTLVRRS